MLQFRSSFGYVFRGAAAWMAWLALSSPLWADSAIITPSPEYQATDHLTSLNVNGYDVSGDMVAVYANQHLEVYNRNTWQPLYNLGDANYGGLATTYNSFVKFDPGGQSLWVGYTVGGNVNDRIYQVTNLDTTPTWNYVATLPSNYDLAFSGTTPYVSGLNSTEWGGPNSIWRLDTSGNNQHTLIAPVGGFAAGIAFDATGNLYYGTNLGANDKLVKFTAADVNQINPGDDPLSLADATVLSSLLYPAADVTVDGAGHVLFTVNQIDSSWKQWSSTLAMWNGTIGDDDNYDVVGTAAENHAYTFIHAMGDVTTSGVAYLADAGAWGGPPLGMAEIRPVPVPEPTSAGLAASALLMLGWRCCRRR